MAHEVESMAWAHQVPWHGLGVNVDHKESVDNWLHQAGLDWTVSQRPVYTVNKDSSAYILVDDRWSLARDTDDRIFTITGDRWIPLQNRDAMSFFKSFTAEGGATMETAGSLKGGQMIWGLASLNDKFFVGNKADTVKGYLLLVWRHLLGTSIVARVTPIRVVCANTMAMAMKGTAAIERRWNHIGKFNPAGAADAMGLVREDFVQFGKLANQLSKLKLSHEEVLGILGPLVQPQTPVEDLISGEGKPAITLQELLTCYQEAPGAQVGTGWGVLNAVTYWADHVGSRNQDSRLASSWLGSSAARKEKVLASLLEMV